jgi:hypothetical protein
MYVAEDVPGPLIPRRVRFDSKKLPWIDHRHCTPLPELEKSECDLGHIFRFFSNVMGR